jgi:hypothetical protein
MADDGITVCHVPTGERFEFLVSSEHHCDCRDGQSDISYPHLAGRFDYSTKTYAFLCPACGKEIAVYEALSEGSGGKR